MTRMPSNPSVLLLGLFFLVSCSTLPVNEKHGAALKKPFASQPAGGVTAVPEIPKSDSSNDSLESPAVPPQETAMKNVPADAAPPATPNLPWSVIEPVDSVSSDISNAEALSAANEPALAEPFADAFQVSLPYNESAGDPDEEITYDVPIVRNESVEDYVEYFQTRLRDKFKLWLERSGRYIPIMREIFKEHGLPEDLVFVALIESGFNPYAYSRARAVGPWQFMKATGLRYGLRIDSWVDERRDPIKSTRAAARYLKDLYSQFGSWPLAMAGYNAGEGKIGRALVKAKADDFWDLRSTRYIRPETKGYVPKFMAATIIAKNPERYGFTLDYHEPLRYDVTTLPASADLRVVAQAAGVPYEEIKALNPELKTELTPPTMEHYSVRLPLGTQQTFADAYSRIPEERKIIGTRYSIRRNDTLSAIAKRFGATVSLLREINRLPQGHRLREGEVLFIPKLQSVPREFKPRVAAASKKPPVQMATAAGGGKILYRVKDGDTLWDISKSFNVSVQDLKRFNDLGRRSLIRPGDQLILGFQSKNL